ncbi:amino acid ABC transporter substrate-binding protein [Candidatus Saccharibacteria bacterium]|nr:amino acid ABC transporter substrate-binding protein [Candidatus Saccharibacteria bacterium]
MAKKAGRVKKFFSGWWTLVALIVVLTALNTVTLIQNLDSYDYIVETNAFFAPFEFYDNRKIVGVDIEIINRVAEKLDAKIEIKNVEFDLIIDNVASGVLADAGAAGLTITPARAEKVDFTIPYYTSVQYVIYNKNEAPAIRNEHIVWEALAGKTLGSQMGSTGYIFMSDEIEDGALKDTKTKIKGLDSHQLAADAINAHIIDYAIADELAAQFIVEKNPDLAALPLYYSGNTPDEDYPVEESYAIAVNKQRPELLAAFNEVLTEMLEISEDGKSEIDKLILKYMGLTEETNG